METTKWRKRHGNIVILLSQDDAHAHRKSPLKSVQIAGGDLEDTVVVKSAKFFISEVMVRVVIVGVLPPHHCL